MTPTFSDELLTAREAAEALRVSYWTVLTYIQAGVIRERVQYREGGPYFIPRREVERLRSGSAGDGAGEPQEQSVSDPARSPEGE